MQREGGNPQDFRASISFEYGKRLKCRCIQNGINVVEARPWDTLIDRVIESINK